MSAFMNGLNSGSQHRFTNDSEGITVGHNPFDIKRVFDGNNSNSLD